jgi:hypothetical protein
LCLQVVQVYNYMLTPLLTFVHNNGSGDTGTSSSSSSESQAPTVVAGPGGLGAAEVAKAAAAAAAAAAAKDTATLSGWTLKLIMELCDQVRECSDCGEGSAVLQANFVVVGKGQLSGRAAKLPAHVLEDPTSSARGTAAQCSSFGHTGSAYRTLLQTACPYSAVLFRLVTLCVAHRACLSPAVYYSQGTLRSALDRGVLKLQGAPFADPTLVLMLARDVAAALLHLHR